MVSHVINPRLAKFACNDRDRTESSLRSIGASMTGTSKVYDHASECFLWPTLVDSNAWECACRDIAKLTRLVRSYVGKRLQANVEQAAVAFGVSAAYISLARRSAFREMSSYLARPDFVFVGDTAKVLELNIDSSLGGLGTADDVTVRSLSDVTIREALRSVHYRMLPLAPTLAQLCKTLILDLLPNDGLQSVAIVDWSDEISERPWPYLRLADRLRDSGLNVEIAGEDAWELRRDGFYANGTRCNCVFRGLTPDERLRNHFSHVENVIGAQEQGLAFLLSDFLAPFYSSKLVLAHLYEEADSGALPPERATFVRAVLPWSRILCEKRTSDETQQTIDLVPHILRHRNRYVVKSACGGSAREVHIGLEHSATAWEEVVLSGLRTADHIVQEFVRPVVCEHAVLAPSGVDVQEYHCVFSAFVVGDRCVGSCVRGLPVGRDLRITCTKGAREGIVLCVSP